MSINPADLTGVQVQPQVQPQVQFQPQQAPQVSPMVGIDLEAFRTNVRQQEESKVRETLNSYRVRADNAEAQMATLKLQIDTLTEQIKKSGNGTQNPNTPSAPPAEAPNVKELIASIRQEVEASNKALIDGLKTQLKESKEQEQEARRLAEVSTYKAQKVAGANGRIIPSMVQGTTVEEVDASFATAVAEYERIIAGVNPAPNGAAPTTQQQIAAPGTGATPPAAQENYIPGNGPDTTLVNLERELNESDYKSYGEGGNRERIKSTMLKSLGMPRASRS
jgi:hypothetical protein